MACVSGAPPRGTGLRLGGFELLAAIVSLAVLVFWLAIVVDDVRGSGTLGSLSDVPPLGDDTAPTVSIVVPARNEAGQVERGVGSLLALDYPHCEIVAVNDRSTDLTGSILDRLAQADQRLQVMHVDSLPDGWLGKNHALAAGAARSTGEWILFTDADVVLKPTALSRAMRYARERCLDHLTVTPVLVAESLWVRAFFGGVALVLSFFVRPWQVRNPRSGAFMGVGAFNLVRRSAYCRIGGHGAIRLRPDDDMKLAKCLKRAGLRADVLLGGGQVTVEWYRTLGEGVRGLEKNAFAVLDYSVVRTVLATAFLLAVAFVPFVGTALVGGWPRWIFAAGSLAALFVYYRAAETTTKFLPAQALLLPLVDLLWAYIQVRSAVLAIVRGGIVWRDTFYSLGALRRNRV